MPKTDADDEKLILVEPMRRLEMGAQVAVYFSADDSKETILQNRYEIERTQECIMRYQGQYVRCVGRFPKRKGVDY